MPPVLFAKAWKEGGIFRFMAFLFCAFNGFFQAHNIIHSAQFKHSDLYSPNFNFEELYHTANLVEKTKTSNRMTA